MKVLHVIPSLSPKHGGPSFAVDFITRGLQRAGVAVDIATTDDDGPGFRLNVLPGKRIELEGRGIFYFRKQTEFYKVSLPFSLWAARHLVDYDVISVHALFCYTSTSAAYQARLAGIPYIIIPHGILNRWGIENRHPLLKKLSLRLIEKPLLRDAAAMYYTSRAEQREAEQTGASAPAAVIPHGINLEKFQNLPGREVFINRFPQATGRTLVLFLSRLDVKKGLDLLLPAFAVLKRKHPKAMLVIAGDGRKDYVAGLHKQAAQLGVGQEVLWVGFLDGVGKLSAFAAASMFVLPSYSENFGIALVEAMATGLPCVTTDGVAVSEDILEHNAGIVVKADVKLLSGAMNRLLDDAALRARLSANAKKLAKERFSLDAMGTALRRLYEDILSRKKD
jgi:glycosyltransferase involved in cell wall biosynthesis